MSNNRLNTSPTAPGEPSDALMSGSIPKNASQGGCSHGDRSSRSPSLDSLFGDDDEELVAEPAEPIQPPATQTVPTTSRGLVLPTLPQGTPAYQQSSTPSYQYSQHDSREQHVGSSSLSSNTRPARTGPPASGGLVLPRLPPATPGFHQSSAPPYQQLQHTLPEQRSASSPLSSSPRPAQPGPTASRRSHPATVPPGRQAEQHNAPASQSSNFNKRGPGASWDTEHDAEAKRRRTASGAVSQPASTPIPLPNFVRPAGVASQAGPIAPTASSPAVLSIPATPTNIAPAPNPTSQPPASPAPPARPFIPFIPDPTDHALASTPGPIHTDLPHRADDYEPSTNPPPADLPLLRHLNSRISGNYHLTETALASLFPRTLLFLTDPPSLANRITRTTSTNYDYDRARARRSALRKFLDWHSAGADASRSSSAPRKPVPGSPSNADAESTRVGIDMPRLPLVVLGLGEPSAAMSEPALWASELRRFRAIVGRQYRAARVVFVVDMTYSESNMRGVAAVWYRGVLKAAGEMRMDVEGGREPRAWVFVRRGFEGDDWGRFEREVGPDKEAQVQLLRGITKQMGALVAERLGVSDERMQAEASAVVERQVASSEAARQAAGHAAAGLTPGRAAEETERRLGPGNKGKERAAETTAIQEYIEISSDDEDDTSSWGSDVSLSEPNTAGQQEKGKDPAHPRQPEDSQIIPELEELEPCESEFRPREEEHAQQSTQAQVDAIPSGAPASASLSPFQPPVTSTRSHASALPTGAPPSTLRWDQPLCESWYRVGNPGEEAASYWYRPKVGYLRQAEWLFYQVEGSSLFIHKSKINPLNGFLLAYRHNDPILVSLCLEMGTQYAFRHVYGAEDSALFDVAPGNPPATASHQTLILGEANAPMPGVPLLRRPSLAVPKPSIARRNTASNQYVPPGASSFLPTALRPGYSTPPQSGPVQQGGRHMAPGLTIPQAQQVHVPGIGAPGPSPPYLQHMVQQHLTADAQRRHVQGAPPGASQQHHPAASSSSISTPGEPERDKRCGRCDRLLPLQDFLSPHGAELRTCMRCLNQVRESRARQAADKSRSAASSQPGAVGSAAIALAWREEQRSQGTEGNSGTFVSQLQDQSSHGHPGVFTSSHGGLNPDLNRRRRPPSSQNPPSAPGAGASQPSLFAPPPPAPPTQDGPAVRLCPGCNAMLPSTAFIQHNGTYKRLCRRCWAVRGGFVPALAPASPSAQQQPGTQAAAEAMGYMKCPNCPRWFPEGEFRRKDGKIGRSCPRCKRSVQVSRARRRMEDAGVLEPIKRSAAREHGVQRGQQVQELRGDLQAESSARNVGMVAGQTQNVDDSVANVDVGVGWGDADMDTLDRAPSTANADLSLPNPDDLFDMPHPGDLFNMPDPDLSTNTTSLSQHAASQNLSTADAELSRVNPDDLVDMPEPPQDLQNPDLAFLDMPFGDPTNLDLTAANPDPNLPQNPALPLQNPDLGMYEDLSFLDDAIPGAQAGSEGVQQDPAGDAGEFGFWDEFGEFGGAQ